MKLVLTLTLSILLLSACQPAVMAPMPASTEPPAQMSTPTAFVGQVKEVTMVTQTPTPPAFSDETGVPTTDPNLPTPTRTPVGLFQTLEDVGVPAATYQDQVTGLAFDYPANWIINPISDADKKSSVIYTVTLRSGEVTRGPKQQEGIPPGMTAVDVTVVKNGPKTYTQAVNERRASAANNESGQVVVIQSEEEWVLRGGLPAHHFLYNLGKDPTAGANSPDNMSSELVTMINGQMVMVSGVGDQSLFNIVAGSLRELK